MVELVIVIVIIGIVAAIAVPRISKSATKADESALVANLKIMRHAIDKYAAEHNGKFPGAIADGAGGAANSAEATISQLTQYSDVNGQVSVGKSSDHPFGPYVHKIPMLPVGTKAGSADIVIDSSNSPPLVQAGDAGWAYNPATGEIIANTDDANHDGNNTYDVY